RGDGGGAPMPQRHSRVFPSIAGPPEVSVTSIWRIWAVWLTKSAGGLLHLGRWPWRLLIRLRWDRTGARDILPRRPLTADGWGLVGAHACPSSALLARGGHVAHLRAALGQDGVAGIHDGIDHIFARLELPGDVVAQSLRGQISSLLRQLPLYLRHPAVFD